MIIDRIIKSLRETEHSGAFAFRRQVSACMLVCAVCVVSLTGCASTPDHTSGGRESTSEMESGEALSEAPGEGLSMSETTGMGFDEESITEEAGGMDAWFETALADGELTVPWWEAEEQEEMPIPLQIYTEGAHYLIPGWKMIFDMHLPCPDHNLGLLQGRLEHMLEDYEGTWSAAVRDLTREDRFVIHDEPMPSASVMKLFILGCVYEDILSGRVSRTDELAARMRSMISASSNTDANEIIRILGEGDHAAGIARINAYIRNSGFSENTVIYNPFQEASLVLDPNNRNHTSADDAAEILERIYRRTFATRNACNETEQMLMDSSIRYKIPSALPEGIVVENKTGETDDTENDAALICTPAGDYILTVFSTGWPDKSQAQKRIKEISAETYRYFSDPDYAKKMYPYLDWPEETDLQVLREEEEPAEEDLTETEPAEESLTEAAEYAKEALTEALTEAGPAIAGKTETDPAEEALTEAESETDQTETDASEAKQEVKN